MKELKTTANEFVVATKKMTEDLKGLLGGMVLESDFEPEHLALLQNAFSMLEVSTELVYAQACMIHEISGKLDRLLEAK